MPEFPDTPAVTAPSTHPRGVANELIAIVGLTLAVYINSLSVPFLLDDIKLIFENPSIRQLWPLSIPLQPPAEVGTGGRPLANLTFALNWAAGETNVLGYHLFSLATHILVGLVLFATVRLLLRRAYRREPTDAVALVVTVVWLLHPLLTASVTYISQRTELMMGLCYVLTVYCFLRGFEGSPRRWWSLSVLAAACGMTCKESMVTVPVVILLLDRQFFAGTMRAALAQRRGYYAGLGATWLVLAFMLTTGLDQRGIGYLGVTWWEYALTECGVIFHYLRLAVWPDPLVFDYGPLFDRNLAAKVLPALAWAAIIAATIVAWRRRALAGLVAAIFFLLLAPSSSIVPVVAQPMAENRMYLPLAVLVLAAVTGTHVWLGRRALWGWLGVAVMFGLLAHRRNEDYRRVLFIWNDTIAKRPDNPRAHESRAIALIDAGDLDGAIRAYERSLALDPKASDTHNNLATALIDAGQLAEAAAHFRTSLQLAPNVPGAHYNFGNLLLRLGQPMESAAEHRRAIALRPDLAAARSGLAAALAALGDTAAAIENYTAALRQQPDLSPAHFGLANLLVSANRLTEAIPHYEATLRATPNSAEVHFNLANALTRLDRVSDAIPHYEAALQLKPDFPEAKEDFAKARARITSPPKR